MSVFGSIERLFSCDSHSNDSVQLMSAIIIKLKYVDSKNCLTCNGTFTLVRGILGK